MPPSRGKASYPEHRMVLSDTKEQGALGALWQIMIDRSSMHVNALLNDITLCIYQPVVRSMLH